jgi:hypothetical protein
VAIRHAGQCFFYRHRGAAFPSSKFEARPIPRAPTAGETDTLSTCTRLLQDEEPMPTLTDEIKTFIVKGLACFDSPSQVAAAVKVQFDVEVTRQHVYAYDPNASQMMAPRWRELHAATRQAHLRQVSEIGIANRTVRLAMLDRMARHSFTHDCFGAAASYLEQAAKECGGMYENRRAPIQIMAVASAQPAGVALDAGQTAVAAQMPPPLDTPPAPELLPADSPAESPAASSGHGQATEIVRDDGVLDQPAHEEGVAADDIACRDAGEATGEPDAALCGDAEAARDLDTAAGEAAFRRAGISGHKNEREILQRARRTMDAALEAARRAGPVVRAPAPSAPESPSAAAPEARGISGRPT